ncbi:transposase [Streptomyces sp. NPDC059278]|uniref:transposase n=1 Tax=Streptomyces sp. NPDC059278 TaxID=3346801 RepID=UPI0036C4E643
MNIGDSRINEAATRLLRLEGVSVIKVKDNGAAGSTVYVVTNEDSARVCPSCGVFATRLKGYRTTRRGKPVWKQNPDAGTWELLADAWHIGFVDAVGGRGLFGQVAGRNATSVADCLGSQPTSWREQVRCAAIDPCFAFRAAVHRALPHAAVVADCFHVVQLAQRHPADLRRRLTWKQHGRRARKAMASTPSVRSCAATKRTSIRTNSTS